MTNKIWDKIIALVDMNAFFASIEQRDFPELRGLPVGVTNGELGSCIITCSYEARACGIKTGMRLVEARKRCPKIIQRPARPYQYAKVSTEIMNALQNVTPDIEIFSVDEAFLELTHCKGLYATPKQVGNKIKDIIYETSSLKCSVGISGDKTTAKFAAKRQKPDGLTIIPPWQAKAALQNEPVTSLCGISHGIAGFLAQHGVHLCGDMEKLPISALAKRFGNPGRRIWYMCQGADPAPIETNIAPPKTIGHGKVMPPNTTDKAVILTYFSHMSEKVSSRLRHYDLQAQTFSISLRQKSYWLSDKIKLIKPTNDGLLIYRLCRSLVEQDWNGEGVYQCQVTALDPRPNGLQLELFNDGESLRDDVNHIMDAINERYGNLTVCLGRTLQRSSMPDVISPSWKPKGWRKTV